MTWQSSCSLAIPGEIQPSLTTSASWSRTSVSSMTMSTGDIKLYCSRFQIICFRLIKVVKDRIRTVHQEDRLQNLIVYVSAVVDSAISPIFRQTLSVFSNPLDLLDHSLLLDIFFLGTPQLRTGFRFLFFFKVSFMKHPNEQSIL